MAVVMVLVPFILQLLKLCVIGFVLTVPGSTGYNTSPSPAFSAEIPPIGGAPGLAHQTLGGDIPSSESQPTGSNLSPPLPSLPLTSAPLPQGKAGLLPSNSPSDPIVTPHGAAPPPLIFQGHTPSSSPSILIESPLHGIARSPLIAGRNAPPLQPNIPQAPVRNVPVSAPVATPSGKVAQNSPLIQPSAPETSSPSANTSSHGAPVPELIAPVASPVRKEWGNQPPAQPVAPATMPFVSPGPVASSVGELPRNAPAIHPIMPGESPSIVPGPEVSHASTAPQSIDLKGDGIPVAAPVNGTPKPLPPLNHSPAIAPSTDKATRHSITVSVPPLSPSKLPPTQWHHSPASLPRLDRQNHSMSRIGSPAPSLSYLIPPPSSKQQGPVVAPSSLPTSRRTRYAPLPTRPVTDVSPSPSPSPSSSPTAASSWTTMPLLPKISPGSSLRRTKTPPVLPFQAFPPPPPNEDCSTTVCMDPYTNTPPGSPCGCVLPMQIGLRLSVALYTFFPLVSELAQEIAVGVFMKQSQVRIMGANAASQQLEKTIVLIDLVPLGERFDNTSAFLTYQRFWNKQVLISPVYFSDYEVLYVHYPGLPQSPPSDIGIIDDGPYSGNNNNARTIKPLGVDVQKGQHKNGLGGGTIAIVALSASVGLVLCSAVVWVLLFRNRDHISQPVSTLQALPPPVAKPSGTTGSMIGSGLSFASISFGSSIPPYTGSVKTFSASDIERTTNNFDASRILGEGGFGRVYSGILEDGTKVAVKVLKRDDQQGGREFLAEVEMLSRLHHRNLVKLIGICTEERACCLIYELIPNGSVESHLHGLDKESSPLDWDARIKIALGAARGLAYLHEDSSPRVIHRDFKSSNILLEHDFTPKVSDFGLARTAMEEDRHISTRVMGTFGYVAPEYAMTGHLLVKSDVYSYGVVLLELLTGRKPVDMSQPPGQENLVAWARPLLTTKEGLERIIDPSLGPDVPFDSVAKVAAIASMCVQPEVSHRPFMGEVVQALKLVCDECDQAKEVGSRSSSREFSVAMDAGGSTGSGQLLDPFQNQSVVPIYDSEPDIEGGLSMSDLFSTSERYGRLASQSYRRFSSSGPLRTGRGRRLWQRMRRLTGESASEHGISFRLWPGSQ